MERFPRRFFSAPRSSRVVLACGLALASCASAPPPGPLGRPPGFELRLDYAPSLEVGEGGSLHAAREVDLDPAQAHELCFELLYLEWMPPTTLQPLGGSAELVAAVEEERAIRSATELVGGALIGSGAEAERLAAELRTGLIGRVEELAQRRAVLPLGATALLSLRAFGPAHGPGEEGGELPERAGQLTLHVGRRTDEVRLWLSLRNQPWTRERGMHGEPLAERPDFLASELVLTSERLELGGPPVALIVRSPFAGDGQALAIFTTLAAAPRPEQDEGRAREHAAELAVCAAEVRERALELALPASPQGREDARRDGLSQALGELASARDPRTALVSLSSSLRARAALDLALSAPERELARFLTTLAQLPAEPAASDEQLAWGLDREALALLARTGMEADRATELEAVLILHTGQVGRYPSLVLELLAPGGDRAAFERACVEENQMLLRDSDPGARLRAFDWLRERGLEPPGFDPLGTGGARRAALERAEAAAREGTPAKARP